MKAYIAAPWGCKAEAKAARERLAAVGITSTAGWIDFEPAAGETDPAGVMARESVRDLRDIRKAEAVIVLNVEKSEGKAVETGYALALNKPIFLVGEQSNVFHYHPSVVVVKDIEEIISAHQAEEEANER